MENNMFIRRLLSFNYLNKQSNIVLNLVNNSVLCLCLFVVIVNCHQEHSLTTKNGCYHNGTMFAEESVVPTMEPCLNCRCSNKTLICALRICPEQPIPPPRGCILIHRKDTCCSHLQCSKYHTIPYQSNDRRIISYSYNPMQFNPIESHRITHHGDNNLRRSDDSVLFEEDADICIHNGTVYQSGSAMSSSSLCSYCYCIGGRQKCVKPKCLLAPNGCRPIFIDSTCCPIRYDCSIKDDILKKLLQTQNHVGRSDKNKYYVKNGTQTTHQTRGCLIEDQMHPEGQLLPTNLTKPCEICFCIRGIKKCTPKMCAPSIRNCTPIVRAGECCASSYNCKNAIDSTSRGIQTPLTDNQPRQFDFLSMLFGLDEPDNTTAKYTENVQPGNFYNNENISTTTEKSFFDAIRDGLDMIDNNGDKIGMIIDDGHENKTVNKPIKQNKPNKPIINKDTDNESLLDLLLGPDEDELEEWENRTNQPPPTPPSFSSFQRNPHLPPWSNTMERPNITRPLNNYYTSPWRNNSHAPVNFGEQQYYHNISHLNHPQQSNLPPWLVNSSSNLNKTRLPTIYFPSWMNTTSQENFSKYPSSLSSVKNITKPHTVYYAEHSETDDVYEPLIFPPTQHVLPQRIATTLKEKISTIVPIMNSKIRPPFTSTEQITKTTDYMTSSTVTNSYDESTLNFVSTTTTTDGITNTGNDFTQESDISTSINYESSTILTETTSFEPTMDVATQTETSLRTTSTIPTFITSTTTKAQNSSNPTRKRRPKPKPTRTRTTSSQNLKTNNNITSVQPTRKRKPKPKPTRISTTSTSIKEIVTETTTTQQPTRKNIKDAIKHNEHHLIHIESIPPWRLSLNSNNKPGNDTILIVNTTRNPIQSEIKMETKIKFSDNEKSDVNHSIMNVGSVLTPKPNIIKPVVRNPTVTDADYQYDYNVPTLPPSLPNLKIIPFLPTDAVKNDRKKINYSYYNINPSVNTEKYDSLDYSNPHEPTIYPDFNLNKEHLNDYIQYNLNPTIYPNEQIYGININSKTNSKQDYELFEHHTPSITEKYDKSNSDHFVYDSDYDYDSVKYVPVVSVAADKRYDAGYDSNSKNVLQNGVIKFIKNKFQTGSVINTEIIPSGHDYEKTVYGSNNNNNNNNNNNYGYGEYPQTEYESDASLFNRFSPPTKTEGGFRPREPSTDYYSSAPVRHTTNFAVDMTTEIPLKSNSQNNEKIDITTSNPFRDVIKTKPAPDLLLLIEDKEKLLAENRAPTLNTNFSDFIDNDKNIISITTDRDYDTVTIRPNNYHIKNSTIPQLQILSKVMEQINKNSANKTLLLELAKNQNVTTHKTHLNNSTEPEDDGYFGSVLSFLFNEDKATNKTNKKPEIVTVPPFKSLPNLSTSLNIDAKIIAENITPKIIVTTAKNEVKTKRISSKISAVTTSRPTLTNVQKQTSNIKSSPKIDNINILFPHSDPTQSDLDLILPDINLENENNYKIQAQTQSRNPILNKLPDTPPEIFSKPLNNLLGSGGLKLAGCNIYGRIIPVSDNIIYELSDACLECKCTQIGVHCIPLKC